MNSNRKSITYGDIKKRSACLNSNYEKTNLENKFDHIISQLDENYKDSNGKIKITIINETNNLMKLLADKYTSNTYPEYSLALIERFNNIDKLYSSQLLQEYINCILPYRENLDLINETLNRYELNDDQKKSIVIASSNIIAIDRILKNHQTLSKRFNIQEVVSKFNKYGTKSVTESICELIDTYNLEPYQKLNLCIEELIYAFSKNNISFKKNEVASYVTEYFLLNYPNFTNNDIKGYKKALTESYCLDSSELKNLSFIWEDIDEIEDNNSIDYRIKLFLKDQNKTIESFKQCIYSALLTSITDLKYNFKRILFIIWDIYKADIFDINELNDIIKEWINDFNNSLESRFEYTELSREFIKELLNQIENSISIVQNTMEYELSTPHLVELFYQLKSVLEDKYSVYYTEQNLSIIKSLNKFTLSKPLNKIDNLYKPHILESTINMLIKHINGYTCKAIIENFDPTIDKYIIDDKDIKDSSIFNYNNIYSYIDMDDHKFDKVIFRTSIDLNNDNYNSLLDNLTSELNTQLEMKNHYTDKCYYIINGNIAEIHYKESTPIQITVEELELMQKSKDLDSEIYYEIYNNFDKYLEFINTDTINSIEERVVSLFSNNSEISNDQFEAIMEALSIINIDENIISVFSEKYSKYKYSIISESSQYRKENKNINSILESCLKDKEYEYPYYSQLEAYILLDQYLLEGNNDKKKKEGFKFSNIKLYLQGIKDKIKSLGQKGNEIFKKMDVSFNHFAKSIKDAVTSDRREAIIKGSVLPSFKSCFKIAVALAGIAKFGNPGLALITGIGGLAVSKHLDKKERVLLMDDIEVEMEALDKEISMAESEGRMKRYRTLMKYKKSLQRQYQRIRYNLRIGKEVGPIPSSNLGINND